MNIQTKQINNLSEVKKQNKPKKIPLKYSNWFITINTNKNMNAMELEEKESFYKHFEEVIKNFYEKDISDFVIMKGSSQGVNYGMDKNAPREELIKRIENVSAEYVLEIGEEKFSLHSHALFSIKKRGLETKLDYSKIREYLNEKCGYDVHLNCKLYTDSQKTLSHYITKTVKESY